MKKIHLRNVKIGWFLSDLAGKAGRTEKSIIRQIFAFVIPAKPLPAQLVPAKAGGGCTESIKTNADTVGLRIS